MAVTRTKTTQKLLIFKARIILDPSSQNLIGVDLNPRYRCKPIELVEVLALSHNPQSINRGFKRDPETGYYMKNLASTYDFEEGQGDFVMLKTEAPYGWNNQTDYGEYMSENINPLQQNLFKRYWKAAVDSGQEPKPLADGNGKETYIETELADDIETTEMSKGGGFDVKDYPDCSMTLTPCG